jgi:thiol-disulfide isomerase/thioredoxin
MTKSVLRDLVAGFVALGIVMAGFVTGILGQNLATLVVHTSMLFLFAGLIRGAAAFANPWIKGLLVNVGSSAPVCLMAFTNAAFTSRPHLLFFISTSWLAATAGAHLRGYWQLGRARESLTVAGTWAIATMLVAELFVPAMLETLSVRRPKHVAPAFAFTAVNGGRITSEDLRGRVVVLAFWATWCKPCREELPRLNALYERYLRNAGVVFWVRGRRVQLKLKGCRFSRLAI